MRFKQWAVIEFLVANREPATKIRKPLKKIYIRCHFPY